jgi:hypothetical protein
MKKFLTITCSTIVSLAIASLIFGPSSFSGMNDRMSKVNLKDNPHAVELPEIAAPSGNPSSNTAWLYCKDDGSGVSNIFVEDDSGNVLNLFAPDFLGDLSIAGDMDIGDAASDTLTITSSIDGNVTLDDGVTASPSLIFKDATDETATVAKADSGMLGVTTEAADGVNVLTGNLKVGNGTPDVAQDGEDLYVEGTAEIDGATRIDGAVSLTSTLNVSGDALFGGDVNLGSQNEKTIASDAITVSKSVQSVDTEGDAASDDLATINGGTSGDILILRANHTDRTVVIKDGTGNVYGNGDCTLDSTEDTWMGLFDGSNWLTLSCSDNN